MRMVKIIALLCLTTLVVAGCDDEDAGQEQQLPLVKVSHPYLKKITEWDEYTGRFRAVEEVDVRARVSGYLEEIKFEDGQMVEKGDTLFVIDQRPFSIALKEATARYSLARKEYDRAKRLRKNAVASQETLDRRTSELAAADATLQRAKLDMEYTEVKAPVSGRVSRHQVSIGNLVNGSDLSATVLTSIVSLDPIHFYFEASERELLKYIRLDRAGKREGSRTSANPVEVQLQDEEGYPHKGVMDFVDNRVDIETGTIQGRALIPNNDGVIQPGIFGRARLVASGEYEAMLVPDVLIGTNQAQKFLYVLDENDTVVMRPVQTGDIHDLQWRIITAGLTPEDRIVAMGIQQVRAGAKIAPEMVKLEELYGWEE